MTMTTQPFSHTICREERTLQPAAASPPLGTPFSKEKKVYFVAGDVIKVKVASAQMQAVV